MSGKHFTLADLPPRYLAEVERQLNHGKSLGMARSQEVAKVQVEIAHDININAPLSDSQPQCNQAPALGAAIQGEAKSPPRATVRFIGYRVRPLDPDNFAGSVKDLLDGLRHAQLIPGDEPWRLTLQTEQVRVKTFAEEKTVIEIA